MCTLGRPVTDASADPARLSLTKVVRSMWQTRRVLIVPPRTGPARFSGVRCWETAACSSARPAAIPPTGAPRCRRF